MEKKTLHQIIDFMHKSLAEGVGCYLSKTEIKTLISGIDNLEFEVDKLSDYIDGRDYEDNKRPAPSIQ